MRYCNNPAPENGGMDCYEQSLGKDFEYEVCEDKLGELKCNVFSNTYILYSFIE